MRNNSNLNGTNLKLNKETGKVYSHGWYEIANLNENILNTFPYSSSTIKHIHHVRRYVRTQLKEVYAPMGLNNPKTSILELELMLNDIRKVMNNLKRKKY